MLRHTYGPHPDQFLDLHLPAEVQDGAPAPVAAVLHGGFWRERYRLDLMDALCADLTARGWAAANIEYRRLGTGGGYPTTLDDVAMAIDALSTVAAPLDLDRVVTIGHSAGGHLALWAAGRAETAAAVSVAGAVGQAPVCDLVRAAHLDLGDGVVESFCGGSPEAAPAPTETRRPQAAPARRGAPVARPRRARRHRAQHAQHRLRGRRTRGRRRRRARAPRGRRALRAPRPGQRGVGVGHRLAGALRGMTVPTRADAQALDAADPLSAWRERFVVSDPERIYVDGNSLGRPPAATAAALRALHADWARAARRRLGGLDRAGPSRIGDELGTALLGARPGRDARLRLRHGQPLQARPRRAARPPRRGRLLHRGLPDRPLRRRGPGPRGPAGSTATSRPQRSPTRRPGPRSWSARTSHYRSGALADMAAVSAAAPRGGRADPLGPQPRGRLGGDRPPGRRRGPRRRLHVQVPVRRARRTGLPVGARGPDRRPALADPGLVRPGATSSRWVPATRPGPGSSVSWPGTPPIVALAAVAPGVRALAQAGLPAVQDKGRALTALATALSDAWLTDLGFRVDTPARRRTPAARTSRWRIPRRGGSAARSSSERPWSPTSALRTWCAWGSRP